ncbi:hypothetical protein [Verminephrobacter aporrectodeae]|uniref:hypothetical protein n=1 Tax=Verminephrobacter aporrectodeae TaxID=1110389 RepID=UPI00023753EE|nr:hypothetical protein [Verminephrobacter aporrectodeae]
MLDAETQGRARGMKEGIRKGRVEGLQKGIEKGRKQEKLAHARNLLALLDDEAIAQAIGLTLPAIRKLRQGA